MTYSQMSTSVKAYTAYTQPQTIVMNFLNRTRLISKFIFQYKTKYKLIIEKLNHKNDFQSNPVKDINVLFFGTDKFSLPSLKALVAEQKRSDTTIKNLGVVTSFKSSSNPVRKYAGAENIVCFDWPIPIDVCKSYDLGVVVSFGHLIPEVIITTLPLGLVNVHASLLPRWRGAAPIVYALMNDDRTTGVSVMRILPKHFDIGEILAQKEISIGEDCLMPELHDTLSSEGADLLIDCLRNFESRLENAQPQNPDYVTYAPKVTPALAEINWKATARQVYNLYRALYSFKPVTTKWNNLQVKLIEMKLETSDDISCKSPGTVEFRKSDKCLKVICGNGRSVCVYKLALEGKKVMSAADFCNGFLIKFKDKSYFM